MAEDDKRSLGTDVGTVTEVPEAAAGRQRARRATKIGTSAANLPIVDDDHYEIREEVARGGLGRIVAAYDRRLDREVALKELAVRHPVSEARFGREARLTARLEHPAIIPVHEACEWPSGRPFYVMKLVNGQSLAQAISATQTYEERIALLPHVVDIAEAMAYAHSQRIIHRDLKPSNVLVGSFGETVVIDWGLAKDLDRPHSDDDEPGARAASGDYETHDGAVLGTPAYMPPEQAAGGQVDETADVYALGALLYHCLAGARPYAERAIDELLEAVSQGPPRPIIEIAPEVPLDLAAIVEKAMSRAPAHRYRHAGELADELRRFTTGQLVGAHHYSSRELFRRFVRRQRRILATIAVSLLALVVVGVWSIARISDARDRAEKAAAAELEQREVAESLAKAEHEARDEAEEQNRRLLVSQARLLLPVDPTKSVAALKALDRPVTGAATIVAEAEELGVARHVYRGDLAFQVRAIAATGDFVAWADEDGVVRFARGSDTAKLDIHDGRVPALAFTPSGTEVISGGYDGLLAATSPVTRETRTIAKFESAIFSLAIAPRGDRIAVVTSDGKVHVVEFGGTFVGEWVTTVGRSAFVRFSQDGRFVASGAHGGQLLVIDLEHDRSFYLGNPSVSIVDARFATDSQFVATGDDAGTVRLWPLSGGAGRTVLHADSPITVLRFSDDGDFIAAGTMHGEVHLSYWSRGTSRLLGEHSERVTDVSFALGGDIVASVSWDKSARLWATSKGAARVLRGHEDVVSAVAVGGGGKTLFTASWDSTVRVWPLTLAERRVLVGHQVGVKAVAISPRGGRVVSGAHDNELRLWDPATGRSRVLRGHRDHIYRVLYSPDGALIASSSDDRTIRLWNAEGGLVRILEGHRADVEELVFDPRGEFLVSGAEDNRARIWSLTDRGVHVLSGHSRPVSDVAVSSDGGIVATASLDGDVRLWGRDGSELAVLSGHRAEVWSVDFSPDGEWLYSVGADGSVRRWSTATFEGVEWANLLSGARQLECSPNGDTLVVAGVRGDVWFCSTDEKLRCERYERHIGTVWDVTFSADGRTVASGGADNRVRIWDVATRESRVLYGHSAPVFDVEFASDGRTLVSGSGDGTVRIWDVRLPPSAEEVPGELNKLTTMTSD